MKYNDTTNNIKLTVIQKSYSITCIMLQNNYILLSLSYYYYAIKTHCFSESGGGVGGSSFTNTLVSFTSGSIRTSFVG